MCATQDPDSAALGEWLVKGKATLLFAPLFRASYSSHDQLNLQYPPNPTMCSPGSKTQNPHLQYYKLYRACRLQPLQAHEQGSHSNYPTNMIQRPISPYTPRDQLKRPKKTIIPYHCPSQVINT